MKLYLTLGACSLGPHIALHEAGLAFDHAKVDLRTHRTEDGTDFYAVNPKGYVPALVLDDGETITENIAILDWIAHQRPALKPQGPLGHTRLLEMLAFISTELHKSFSPMFQNAGDDERKRATDKIARRFAFLAERLDGDYLFGREVSVADAYLFVMTLWAGRLAIDLPPPLAAFRDRMRTREAVQAALDHEGLA